MIEHSIQSWVLGLATVYTNHLSKVKTMLEDQLKEEQKQMAGVNLMDLNVFICYVFYCILGQILSVHFNSMSGTRQPKGISRVWHLWVMKRPRL